MPLLLPLLLLVAPLLLPLLLLVAPLLLPLLLLVAPLLLPLLLLLVAPLLPLLLPVVPSAASAPASGIGPVPPESEDPHAARQLAPPHPNTTNAIRVFRFIVD
jgi:hypothetical protein